MNADHPRPASVTRAPARPSPAPSSGDLRATDTRGPATGRRRIGVALGAFTLASLAVAACGSSTGSTTSASQSVQATCRNLGGVLSNGPDPDADPVGYAQAQILPLKRFTITQDAALQRAVDNLAAAYQQFTEDQGAGHAVQQAVTRAAAKVNALCPEAGAAS